MMMMMMETTRISFGGTEFRSLSILYQSKSRAY
jgi:hypothetical protein